MPATLTVHDDADQLRQLAEAAANKLPVTVATFKTAFGAFRVRKRNTPDGPAYSLTSDTAVGVGLIGGDLGGVFGAGVTLEGSADDDEARRNALCLLWNNLLAAVNEVDALCGELGMPFAEPAKAAKGRLG